MTGGVTGAVVVGADFSANAQAAVDYGAWQAEQQHRALHLVHGHDTQTRLGVPTATGFDPDLLDEAKTRLRELAQQVSAAHPDLTVTGGVRQRSGAAALVEASQTAALVVVASRGHGLTHLLVVGSVAAQTAAHAACPVVVVRPSHEGGAVAAGPVELPGKGPVLVGVDGSTNSAEAVEFAFAEADRRGVPVVAASVWGLNDRSDLSRQRPSGESAAEWKHRMEQDCDRVVAEALAGRSERYPDVAVQSRTVNDVSAYQGLVITAHQVHPDLIVVGSRGTGGFTGLLLGSVSQQLVSYGPGTVAVVPSRQPTEESA